MQALWHAPRQMAKAGGDKKGSEAPRHGRARSAGELVGSAGGAAFRRFGFVQSSIVSRWGEIVGERYAKVSSPESIRFPAGKRSGGVLTLVVQGAHAPLMQHLSPLIMERVNRFFGYPAVAKVAFRQGSLPPQRKVAERPQLRPVPKELGEGLREIADPELRACLESLAASIASNDGPPAVQPSEPDPMPAGPASDR
jgi:hypothetical protein